MKKLVHPDLVGCSTPLSIRSILLKYCRKYETNINKKPHNKSYEVCVSAKGFEPLTVCLEGRCSIQLSYAP